MISFKQQALDKSNSRTLMHGSIASCMQHIPIYLDTPPLRNLIFRYSKDCSLPTKEFCFIVKFKQRRTRKHCLPDQMKLQTTFLCIMANISIYIAQCFSNNHRQNNSLSGRKYSALTSILCTMKLYHNAVCSIPYFNSRTSTCLQIYLESLPYELILLMGKIQKRQIEETLFFAARSAAIIFLHNVAGFIEWVDIWMYGSICDNMFNSTG